MTDTYSSAPFISYDAVSPTDRAEVKVTTGYGDIFEIEASDKGKSNNVTFKVSNTKYKSNGWAPSDGNVMAKVNEAKAAGVPIHFRIEVRRKDHVDRTLPIKDISTLAMAKDNVVKSLAAVRLEEDAEWTVSPFAKTRLDEDPRTGGGAGGSANDFSPEQLGIGKPAAAASKPAYNSKNNSFEAAPFATYNFDGSLNYGSAAVAVPASLFSFVVEYERSNEAVGTLTEKQRVQLAKVLLAASNELQVSVYDGKLEAPDLSLGSHTRARALMFETIRTFLPLTAEIVAEKETLKAWRDEVVAKSLAMWKWSISEVEKIENAKSTE
jgi:hypothetical protein